MNPSRCETKYLTPGTDIPPPSGHRAVRHVDKGREATTTTTRTEPQQVSRRARESERESDRGGGGGGKRRSGLRATPKHRG